MRSKWSLEGLKIIGSFTLAGVLGGWADMRLGREAIAIPVTALVLLVVADLVLPLRRKRLSDPPPVRDPLETET